jgi:hypothetical protein
MDLYTEILYFDVSRKVGPVLNWLSEWLLPRVWNPNLTIVVGEPGVEIARVSYFLQ